MKIFISIPEFNFVIPFNFQFTRKFYEFIPVNFEFKKLAQLTLELDILDYEETILDPLDKWLKTESLANLRKLKLSIETIWENTNHRSTIQSLKASNLNLNEFRLNLPQIVGDDVKLLEEFLQSQRNLVRSELSISSNDIGIMKELSELIGNCGSLKVLSLMIDNSDARLQDYSPPTQTWNLNNVENYEIVLCVNGAVSPVLTAEILQAKGDMTQRLNFTCGDFKLYEFQNITRNFPNLVDLSISHFSRNYSSNVIFVILSNLKKLENLSFVFPLGSKLKSEFFEKFADKLVLPKIKRIAFTFNESIDVENARQLMKAVKNASELKLYSWEFYKREFLYVAIEEMPKLRFIYSGDLEEESESHLDEVEKNVKILVWKHNENPLDFELKIKEYSIKL